MMRSFALLCALLYCVKLTHSLCVCLICCKLYGNSFPHASGRKNKHSFDKKRRVRVFVTHILFVEINWISTIHRCQGLGHSRGTQKLAAHEYFFTLLTRDSARVRIKVFIRQTATRVENQIIKNNERNFCSLPKYYKTPITTLPNFARQL
jgi:hypothetical protein